MGETGEPRAPLLLRGARRLARAARAALPRRRQKPRGLQLASMTALYEPCGDDSCAEGGAGPGAPLSDWAALLPAPAAWLQQQLSSLQLPQLPPWAAAPRGAEGAPGFAAPAGAGGRLPIVDTSNTLPALLLAGRAGGGGGGSGDAEAADCGAHSLVAVGHRHWGNWWDGRGLLKVKIYDFAVYADAREARAALAAAFFPSAGGAGGGWRALRRQRAAARREAGAGAPAERAAAAAPAPAAAAGPGAGEEPGWPLAQLPFGSWWQPLLAPAQPEASAALKSAEAGGGDNDGDGGAAAPEAGRRRRKLLRLRLRRRRRTADGAPVLAAAAAAQPEGAALAEALRTSRDCGVSLLLRAARDIPLPALREEYEKVLKRRLARVGGDPSDPALGQLLDSFSTASRLPPAALAPGGGAVRRGASIVFVRRGATVEARVGHYSLGSVTSAHLGDALLDLYLGPQPVSAAAKEAAAQTLAKIVAAAGGGGGESGGESGGAGAAVYYSPRGPERLRCAGGGGGGGGGADASACVVEL
ncbi:hypothetical protein Rsub_11886 [Raphidocelis subcapitata]|uniref:Chalcone isomerase domain-containing protein n=1 Tax=Raphidocelis subcapitata TaxID=307507 RepID=A0A2V0PFJ0_9CHLO|nr:hypothetical protein Rsub_11886 [Raphidocelis subcapitata]|eukprot:GBF98556.1 hypothetical protein Rsub_11886 [Raphidocelis subcapitata]